MESLVQKAAIHLKEANSVACLTGAGASAESGISTFRDPQTGYWSQFNPEELASQRGFRRDPGLVWRWYMERLVASSVNAQPNPGHIALARLQETLQNFTLITQNVDTLHERAGNHDVVHLHGNISTFFCNSCRRDHILSDGDRTAEHPPTCSHCGGMVRPGVVWFGEQLPQAEIQSAISASQAADVMLVIGTSGIVYPAAGLPLLAQETGAVMIDINPDRDALSSQADIFLQGTSGQVLPKLLDEILSL